MLYYLVAVVAIVLDQITKVWAETLQALPGMSHPFWPGVLHFTYAENTGAAFSLLEGARGFFIIVVIAAVVAITWYVISKRKTMPRLEQVMLGMIAGGAIGNGIDRVVRHYVVDFLEVRLFRFAIFNIADCFVVVGTIAFCAWMLFSPHYKDEPKAEAKDESKEKQLKDEAAVHAKD